MMPDPFLTLSIWNMLQNSPLGELKSCQLGACTSPHRNLVKMQSRILKHMLSFFPCYYIQGPSRSCHDLSLVPGFRWKGPRWVVDWILNSEHFRQQNLGFSSLPSLLLPDAQAHTIWLLRILIPSFSPLNSFPHPYSFILVSSKVWLRACSISRALVLQHFSRQLCFLTAFQMDASGFIVYHGTHTQALISPHSFFGHQVSLCFSGYGNLSSKHILLNTKTKNIPYWRSDLGVLCLFLTAQDDQILHTLKACVL